MIKLRLRSYRRTLALLVVIWLQQKPAEGIHKTVDVFGLGYDSRSA
jgi:hypothetical protein